jgi:hypothetical protein
MWRISSEEDEKGQPFDPLAIPVGILHCGVKEAAIRHAGFRLVSDLDGVAPERLLSIPSIGRRTVEPMFERRDALRAAIRSDGLIDWEQYCDAAGLGLAPLELRPASGREFLACLGEVLDELAGMLEDEITAVILRERICRAPASQRTLDDIADLTSPRVTRERIRQKEKFLLRQLTGGLLSDVYHGLDIHFHPDFSRWWRMASERLAGYDELGFVELIELLAEVWDADVSAVVRNMPIILAVITGDPQMPAEFRAAIAIDHRWYGDVPSSLSDTKVLKLRLGKDAEAVTAQNLNSVADLAAAFRGGRPHMFTAAVSSRVLSHMNLMASCFTSEGYFDWKSYQTALGLETVPAGPPSDAAEFAKSLTDHVREILRTSKVTGRAPEIFDLRTSRSPETRMTLHQLADALASHGPSIKREETVFLQYLHDVLVEGEFYSLPIWVEESWLTYWKDAARAFRIAGSEYESFADYLAWQWRLRPSDLAPAMPTIWAVLTGYPNGRPHRGAAAARQSETSVPLGRIRLQGFRRLH